MAVFTKINGGEIKSLLANYNLGSNVDLLPIEKGTDNSNYIIVADGSKFILTIIEEHLIKKDVGFCLSLLGELSKTLPCAKLIRRKDGEETSKIQGKTAFITSYLEGKSADTIKITNNEISELGTILGNIHKITSNMTISRVNNFALTNISELFGKIKSRVDEFENGLANEITENLREMKEIHIGKLPNGIVHADLFPDNALFSNGKISGIIDFYFACNDNLILDLAVCANSWCFADDMFNVEFFKELLISYNKIRELQNNELKSLNYYLQLVALRFLITRLYSLFNTPNGALFAPKDPKEYLDKLRYFRSYEANI